MKRITPIILLKQRYSKAGIWINLWFLPTEAQVLFVQTLHDMVAEEGQDLRLEIRLSSESAEVQWMKQGILLQQSTKYSMEAQGHQRALTVHNIELSDRGTYRCESLHDRTQARLSVERTCQHLFLVLVLSV